MALGLHCAHCRSAAAATAAAAARHPTCLFPTVPLQVWATTPRDSMEAAQEAAAAGGEGGDVQQAADAAAKEAAAAAPAAGFSKRKNRGNIRKRAADSDGEGGGEEGGGGGVVRKAAKQKEAPLGFTTKRADRAEVFAFESSKTLQQRASDATRANEQETAHDRDARWARGGWARQCLRACRAVGGAGGVSLGLSAAARGSLLPAAAACRPLAWRSLPPALPDHSCSAPLHPPPAARCASRCWRRRRARR